MDHPILPKNGAARRKIANGQNSPLSVICISDISYYEKRNFVIDLFDF